MEDLRAAAQNAALKLGYSGLKDLQMDVVIGLATGRDVFAVLPTGYGKSLCYACLPVMFDLLEPEKRSIVIVVSPLTAIIQDQVSEHH